MITLSREGSCILPAFPPSQTTRAPCFSVSVTCGNSENRSKVIAIKVEPLAVHLLAALHCSEEIERCWSVHCDTIVEPMAAGKPHTFLRNLPPPQGPASCYPGSCRLPVEGRLASIAVPPPGDLSKRGRHSAKSEEFAGVLG